MTTNHVMTGKQIQSIFILFWMGSLVISSINPEAKQDSWISVLMAGVMILPLFAILIRITKLYPGLNLFEIMFKVFGGILGRILAVFFISYCFLLGTYVIKIFAQFVKILNMPETPELLIQVFMMLLSVWAVKSGPEVIGRLCKFLWPIAATLTTLATIVATKYMDFNNLKPVMETNFKSLLSGAFFYFAIPFGEVVVCLSLFSSVSTKASTTKIYAKSLISFLVFILVVILRNTLVLGIPNELMYYFASYQCVSIISVGDFFTRIEVLIGIDLMLGGFTKVCVCVYASSLGMAKIFNIQDQKTMAIPCGLIMIMLAIMFYPIEYTWLNMYRIYAFPFQVIFPVMMWIGAEIQTKTKAVGANANTQA
jgi:spore germination protein KB